MPLLGSFIKKAVELGEALTHYDSPVEEQEKVLRSLLKTAQDTAFGKHYNFAQILKSDTLFKTFAERVPTHDYDKIHTHWWHRTLAGEADVTWPALIASSEAWQFLTSCFCRLGSTKPAC